MESRLWTGDGMKELHARALILLNFGEKANAPEIKAKAAAVAQMWLTIAALEDALTLWRDQVEMERAQRN
jgi:hypothetical protein